jgi:lambda family phage tail tape measure protein
MADRELKIAVTADSEGAVVAFARAKDSIAKYAKSTDDAKQVLQKFDDALRASGADTEAAQLKIARYVIELDRTAKTAGKTRGELLEMKAQVLGVGNAFAEQIEQIKHATSAHHEFSAATFKTAGVQREMLVLFHELSQGRGKQFASSLLVMASRMNLMSLLFNPVALGIAAIGGSMFVTGELVHKAGEELQEYAAHMSNLSQQTGLTTKAAQEISFAFGAVGMDSKDSAKSIIAFSESLNKAKEGNKENAKAFQALGLSMGQLKSMDSHEALLAVADAFHASADGAGKAAVAQELFGSEWEKALPLLNQGREGINSLTDEANKLGGVLADNTVIALDQMKEKTEHAHASMEAMSRHAKAQLLPAISAITDAFSDNAVMGPVLDGFYKGLLEVFRAVVTAAATVVTGVRQIITTVSTLDDIAADLTSGNWDKIAGHAKAGYDKMKQEGQDYLNFQKKLYSDEAQAAAAAHKEPKGTKEIHFAKGTGGEHKPKHDENALNGEIAALNTQLKNLEDARKDSLDVLKGQFEQGLLTYQDYYTKQIAIDEDAYKKEEDLQRKRIALAEQKHNLAAAQTAQQELGRIEHEHVKAVQTASDSLGREWKKRQDAFTKFVDTQNEKLREQEEGYASAIATPVLTQREAADYAVRLKLYDTYQKDKRKIEDAYPGDANKEEQARRLAIVEDGYAKELKAYENYKKKEDALRNDYGAQIKIAFKQQQGDGITTAEAMGQAFTATYNDISSALETFVTTGKLSFGDLAASILEDLAKIVLKMLEVQAVTAAMSFFTGGSGAPAAGGNSYGFTMPLAKASGGHISGPGTGTSDSIPAMLSNGEYVIKADAAAKHRGLLDAINSGQAAHFATGGPVGTSSASSASSGGGANVTVNVTSGDGGGMNPEDSKALQAYIQAFFDKRLDQKMRGQGGYAYQIKHGNI